jgi:phosphoglycolate phosphatase-like HAD superfamily hydrolase
MKIRGNPSHPRHPRSIKPQRRLYLFDVDGTLLHPGPVARQSLNRALESVLGVSPDLQIADVAGLTDPVIVRNTLRRYGVNGEIGDQVELILERYLERFEPAYAASDAPRVFRDALTLLERVEQAGQAVALLTGNVRRAARIKLGRFGLFDRFPFGVFGDDAEGRCDLPWVARERAWDILRESFRFQDMVIVGDTPNDARLAREYGAHSLIVCRRPEWRNAIHHAGAEQVVERLDDPNIEIPHCPKE